MDFEYVIKPQFHRTHRFKKFYDNYYAVVEDSNYKRGIIDCNGNYVIEPIYFALGPNKTELDVEIDGHKAKFDGYKLIDVKRDTKRDTKREPPSYPSEEIRYKLSLLKKEYGKNYFILSNETYTVEKDGKWGTVDINGNIVIPFISTQPILDLGEGICELGAKDVDGKYYVQLADYNGKLLSDLKFSHQILTPKFEGPDKIIPVKLGRKWGYINSRVEWVIQPRFMEAGLFADNGLASVRSFGYHGKCGYIRTI